MSYNNQFMDYMDLINNIAKEKGFVNGINWSSEAKKAKELSFLQHLEHEKCHKLRNSVAHGNARDISVSRETFHITKEFLKRIQNSQIYNIKLPKNEKQKTDTKSYVPIKEEPTSQEYCYKQTVDLANKLKLAKIPSDLLSADANKELKENLSYATKFLKYMEQYLEYPFDEKKTELFKVMKDIFFILEDYYLRLGIHAKLCRVFRKYNDQSVETCEASYKEAHKLITSRYDYDNITISEFKSAREALKKMVVDLNEITDIYVKN